MPNDKLKLLIVDDSLTMRAILDELAEHSGKLQVAGAAANAEDALGLIGRLLPDVIALDIGLPGMNGIELLDRIRAHWHDMKVVIVSSAARKDDAVCANAFDHGALACFDKAKVVSCGRELMSLLDEVGHGRVRRAAHKGGAVTLPASHDHHAPPQQQGEGVVVAYFSSTSSSAMLG
jgi:chemotaxis response regulator CheB